MLTFLFNKQDSKNVALFVLIKLNIFSFCQMLWTCSVGKFYTVVKRSNKAYIIIIMHNMAMLIILNLPISNGLNKVVDKILKSSTNNYKIYSCFLHSTAIFYCLRLPVSFFFCCCWAICKYIPCNNLFDSISHAVLCLCRCGCLMCFLL